MALISSSIPNLISGVSQQPYLMRTPTQAERQENFLSSVVDGLRKRPPTTHLAKLQTYASDSDTEALSHLHTIDRDGSERYVVVVPKNATKIRVFDLAGVEKTVTYEELTDTLLSSVTSTSTGTGLQLYIADGTNVTLTSTGITTATVVWEMSAVSDFSSGVTTLRTDTANTDAAVGTFTTGNYIRARVSAYTSGTITCTVKSNNLNYLQTTDSAANIKMLTVADNTFIVNQTVTTAMQTDLTTTRGNEALVRILSGQYGRNYQIALVPATGSGVTVSYQTNNGGTASDSNTIDTVHIATQLTSALTGSGIASDITVTRYGNSIHIKWNDGRAFSMAVEDGYGGKGMIGIKKKVGDYKDLPLEAPDGYHVEVTGDDDNAFDSFYVKFEKDDTADSKGVWKETVAEGIKYKLNAASLPHTLQSNADGTFTFKQLTYGDRIVGDDTDSAVDPSFIDYKINDVFFYKNRFGFLSDENVILSKAGDYFKFFPDTATTILDDGPIDVATTHTKVSILRHAIPFNESLLLFSSQTQFILKGADLLTPSTVAINQTTEFETSINTRPVGLGRFVYFATEKSKYSAIREYFVEETTDVNDSVDITAHVPKYIPTAVTRILTSDAEDVVAVLTSGETNAIYFYNFFYNGTEKIQSSWSKWVWPTTDKILNADFIGSKIYLLIERASDGLYLESLDVGLGVTETDSTYQYYIDRKINESKMTISYNSGTGLTTWVVPYNTSDSQSRTMVVRAGNTDQNLTEGTVLSLTRVNDTTFTKTGDYTATKVMFGWNYTSRYRFSIISVKDSSTTGHQASIGAGNLTINNMYVFFADTGFFNVEVTPELGSTSTYTFTGRVVGAGDNVLGTTALETGRFEFPIAAENSEVVVDLVSDSFLPVAFQAAEWDGEFVLQSRRM